MKIAVTGASGNLGSALLRRILAEGTGAGAGDEVLGISRRSPTDLPAGVTWSEIDVAADDAPQRLSAAFEGYDAVVHLAWMIRPGHDESILWRTNVRGSRNVLEAAER